MKRSAKNCDWFIENEDLRENLAKQNSWQKIVSDRFGCPRNTMGLRGRTDSWFAQMEVRFGWWSNDPCCPGTENPAFTFCSSCQMNPGASFCIQSQPLNVEEHFSENGTSKSSTESVSNQCCYDKSGNLITDSLNGGGIAKRSVNNIDNIFHFYNTEYSFYMSCCRDEQKCKHYYIERHTLIGRYNPPRRVINTGDPHFQSLDGFKYTFNGLGVYTMFEVLKTEKTENSGLTLQVSTRRVGNGTVFSGFVVADNSTSAEFFLLDGKGTVSISINGTKQFFDQNSRVTQTDGCVSREVTFRNIPFSDLFSKLPQAAR